MSSQPVAFIMPPNTLKARVCGDGDGPTFEEMLAACDAIVERTAAQWRHGALLDTERLSGILDRARRDPPELGPALSLFFSAANNIADQAEALGFMGVRDAAMDLCADLSGIDAEGGNFGDPIRHVGAIERRLIALQIELGAGRREQAADVGWLTAAD